MKAGIEKLSIDKHIRLDMIGCQLLLMNQRQQDVIFQEMLNQSLDSISTNFKFLILINPIHNIIHNLKSNIFPHIQPLRPWHIHRLEWINWSFIILLFIYFLHFYYTLWLLLLLLLLLLCLLLFIHFFILTSSFSDHWCCYVYLLLLLVWVLWCVYCYLWVLFYVCLFRPLLFGFRFFFT